MEGGVWSRRKRAEIVRFQLFLTAGEGQGLGYLHVRDLVLKLFFNAQLPVQGVVQDELGEEDRIPEAQKGDQKQQTAGGEQGDHDAGGQGQRPQPCFAPNAWVTTWDTRNDHVLALVRRAGNETLVCLFNFSAQEQEIRMDCLDGEFTDLISGEETICTHRTMAGYQYALCRRRGINET